MSQVTIRQVKAEDAEDIARLSEQLGYPATPEQMHRRIIEMLSSQHDKVFVAISLDGAVVGWIHVFAAMRLESEPFAEIGGIVVDSDHRNQGIGKKLLARTEQWAVKKNLTRLRVRSRTSRDEAHRFFKNFGFTQSKTQQIFDKPLGNRKR